MVYLYMYLISAQQVRRRLSSLILGVGRVPVHVPHFILTSQAEIEFTDFGGLVGYMYLISS